MEEPGWGRVMCLLMGDQKNPEHWAVGEDSDSVEAVVQAGVREQHQSDLESVPSELQQV